MKASMIVLGLGLGLTACTSAYNPLDDYEQLTPTTVFAPAEVQTAPVFPAEAIARGEYLVKLLGCGGCHTNGALIGEPVPGQLLAGSNTGIAWSNPLEDRNPGVVYPANLTPDMETGIGSWSVTDLVRMIQTGVDNHSAQASSVMPWPSFVGIETTDATAIAQYLLSLEPVRHRVPDNVRPGQRAVAPFVHFGIYRSRR